MKNIPLFSVIAFILLFGSVDGFAQAGPVYTVAGGGSSTAEGVPATSASLLATTGVAVDGVGNVYFADKNRYVVRKIDGGSGLIYTVAGIPGSTGFSGDGGPATAAKLSKDLAGIHVTGSGDIYISDFRRVRKVDGATGVITTVAGGGVSTADGVPATSAFLYASGVYLDTAGHLYIGSQGRIRKVDKTTGLITTVAGGGTSTADGIPATIASIYAGASSICMDNAQNIYIIDSTQNRVRKINASTGLISTVAGGGTSTDDGVPATSMLMNYSSFCRVDGGGNIFIADWLRKKVRRVDAVTGIVNTIAGVTLGGSTADGTPALFATLNLHKIWLDPSSGYIYYSDHSTKIRRFSYASMIPLLGTGGSGISGYLSDSFYAQVHKTCSGPQLTLRTHAFHAGLTVRTDFGDGTHDTSTFSSSWSGIGGYRVVSHVYPYADTFTIKHILLSSGVPIDSFSYSYGHLLCTEMRVRFYNDADLNCSRDTHDYLLHRQTITEIDSNGVPVDTIAATSGFSYMAYGNAGDVYRFKLLSWPSALYRSCPASGILYDTLRVGMTINPVTYQAMSCASAATPDIDILARVRVTGPNDQWGYIYYRNDQCTPATALVTLNFSPKYRYIGTGAYPAPVSSTATSITWNVSDFAVTESVPDRIYYEIWHNPAVPYPPDGDTVNSKFSIVATSPGGDADLSNNLIIRTDTVRTSTDPNAIEVKPGCFENDTTFEFTVHFENIGSAPAENIYVMDTLSWFFDPSTLNIEMNSHPMFTSKYTVNGMTILKFDFPEIYLADSSDHANRSGTFIYTIKNKPGMPVGASAKSRVGIYFDYNDVLMTNEVTNTKGCPPPPTNIANNGKPGAAVIYPNPATNEFSIRADGNNYTALTITNTMGQTVLQYAVSTPQQTYSVKDLPSGVYYVTLKGDGGTQQLKLVKW
ncbi:MAG: T9SS type A sorting domain-containing protein [Flavipsychrobacter sp.]|nr:T9SS type A sorting domain-containing protein [Flavipsychrobacter sp.]